MKNLDGRHKLAVVGALVCWVLSVWFSYLGFKIDADKVAFVGWVMAGVVTIVELVFNSQTGKLSLTLVVTGILCYAYGIWTNVIGFWDLQHPGVGFIILSQRSIMSAFVGIILEVLPEPLLMWGLMSNMDGDFLGNMVGLWNGKLSYAQPSQSQQAHNNQSTSSATPKFTPSHKPNFNPAPKHGGVPAGFRPAPKPIQGGDRPEPTYHHFEA